MRRLVAVAALVLLTGCVTGCVAPVEPIGPSHSPLCQQRGVIGSNAVVLMAQAVPSAKLLPCIELLPTGWTYGNHDVRNGLARFWLNSDRAGQRAVEVTLSATCDVAGATPITPSDQEGTKRYERVQEVRTRYRGSRTYVFEGGCVTYGFNFQGPSRGTPEAEVTFALGFVPRARLAETLSDVSDGRLHLDP
jgi:hypothetical protein